MGSHIVQLKNCTLTYLFNSSMGSIIGGTVTVMNLDLVNIAALSRGRTVYIVRIAYSQ